MNYVNCFPRLFLEVSSTEYASKKGMISVSLGNDGQQTSMALAALERRGDSTSM